MSGKNQKAKFYLIDKKFKYNKKKYIIQCIMAAVAISAILILLAIFFETAVLAAFGATSFIVFAMPHRKASIPRRLIGGYLVGIMVGVGMFFLESMMPHHEAGWVISVFGAVTVAITIFLMTTTNTEHPPAAGAALGIALEGFEPIGLLILFLAVCTLVLVKYALRKWMIDLF